MQEIKDGDNPRRKSRLEHVGGPAFGNRKYKPKRDFYGRPDHKYDSDIVADLVGISDL